LLKSTRQFFQAILLKPKKKDIEHYLLFLNIGEKALFNQFPVFEKLHAIAAAKKIEKLVHGDAEIDERMLVRAVLLHDIGRISGKISLFDKVWLKLLKKFMPPVYNRLAERGKDPGSKARKFYIHKYHGEVGREFLERAGTDKNIMELIEKHAHKPQKSDPIELKLLRKADSTS